jgi:hypothetical protein
MVAILMVIISMIISERVLNKLYEMQEQHLAAVVGTYFDGLSTALMPAVLREDIWETYDILDRTPSIFTTVAPLETVVTGRDDKVIATSDPRKTPVLSPLPVEYAGRISGDGTQIDWSEHTGFGVRPLLYQGRRVGTVHASFDISHLVAERRQVLYTLLATNAVLALVFATAGYLIARRMVNPVKTLADHMRSGATGSPSTQIQLGIRNAQTHCNCISMSPARRPCPCRWKSGGRGHRLQEVPLPRRWQWSEEQGWPGAEWHRRPQGRYRARLQLLGCIQGEGG